MHIIFFRFIVKSRALNYFAPYLSNYIIRKKLTALQFFACHDTSVFHSEEHYSPFKKTVFLKAKSRVYLNKYQPFQGTWCLCLSGRTSSCNLKATIYSELSAHGYPTHGVTPQKTPDFCCLSKNNRYQYFLRSFLSFHKGERTLRGHGNTLKRVLF